MYASAFLSVFYYFAFLTRAFVRFWRYGDKDWLWLKDVWSAVVVGTMLGALALTLWLMTSAPPTP